MKNRALFSLIAIFAFSLFITSNLQAFQQDDDGTYLLRQPTVSEAHLVFVYAGDLWRADRDGSNPLRLTSSPSEENNPFFSPDGSMIAFSASYEGNTDVYVVSVEGGTPSRLTWHPGSDIVTGWGSEGNSVGFYTRRETDHGRSGHLYHVSWRAVHLKNRWKHGFSEDSGIMMVPNWPISILVRDIMVCMEGQPDGEAIGEGQHLLSV